MRMKTAAQAAPSKPSARTRVRPWIVFTLLKRETPLRVKAREAVAKEVALEVMLEVALVKSPAAEPPDGGSATKSK